MDDYDIPQNRVELVTALENLLIAVATGSQSDELYYQNLRRAVVTDIELEPLVPSFVKVNRSLSIFWSWIKTEKATYAERRLLLSAGFTPLIDYLENRGTTPGDILTTDTLSSFDEEGVNRVWTKALERREKDPEGAITAARTLIETVLKRILDETGQNYTDKEDLPKLYRLVAKTLNLAPDQHSEVVLKEILSGATGVVNGLGSLRNRMSDAHGRGGKLPVRPSARHAKFAVNIAGTMATFLIETYQAFKDNSENT